MALTGTKLIRSMSRKLAKQFGLMAAKELLGREMGVAARRVVSGWGPERFSEGLVGGGRDSPKK